MFSPCGYPMKTYAHRRRLKNMYNSIHTFLNRNDNLDAVVSVCIFLVKILFKKKTFFACILFIDFWVMHFFPVIWAFTHVVCELTILLSNQPSCKVNSLCVCVCESSSYTTLCPGLTGWWLIGLGRDGSSSKILVGKHWGGGGEVKNNKGFYKEYRPKSIKTTSKTIHIIISRGNLSRNPDFFYWIREVWGIFLFSSTNVFFFFFA